MAIASYILGYLMMSGVTLALLHRFFTKRNYQDIDTFFGSMFGTVFWPVGLVFVLVYEVLSKLDTILELKRTDKLLALRAKELELAKLEDARQAARKELGLD